MIVDMVPTRKAMRSVPVSDITLRRLLSYRRRGIASGIRFVFTKSNIGEENGIIPRLAMINAKAIVARGADRAFPIFVLLSKVNPNDDKSITADNT
jgi:hypothetical protein